MLSLNDYWNDYCFTINYRGVSRVATRRRFSGLNFIQSVHIDVITCTFTILYIQECLNHGGSNSIKGGNRKFFGCTKWSTIELEICWKYDVLYVYMYSSYIYNIKSTLLKSILSDYYSCDRELLKKLLELLKSDGNLLKYWPNQFPCTTSRKESVFPLSLIVWTLYMDDFERKQLWF